MFQILLNIFNTVKHSILSLNSVMAFFSQRKSREFTGFVMVYTYSTVLVTTLIFQNSLLRRSMIGVSTFVFTKANLREAAQSLEKLL